MRGIRCDWYRTKCKKRKTKRDMQLDHLHAPFFVFNSFSHG